MLILLASLYFFPEAARTFKILFLSVCVYMKCRYKKGLGEGIGSLGDGVTGSHKLLSVVLGTELRCIF